MSEFVISTRYANALMSKVEEPNEFNRLLEDVTFVKMTVEGSKELRLFLSNPIISSTKKYDALVKIFEKFVGKDLIQFFNFLIMKNRESLLADICNRFIELANIKLNQSEVLISSAIELNISQKQELKLNLERIIEKKVIASFIIDKEIIGGFKAKFGDTVIDASLKHQLAVLKKKLFENSYLKN